MTNRRLNYFIPFLIIACSLTACSSLTSKYEMDEATRNHPATSRFIEFSKKAKTAESYEELVADFYTAPTQKRIDKLMGWYRFLYSSAYETLKDGDCNSIQLTRAAERVQIDCVGTTIIPSMFIGDREEAVHLRVFMVRAQDQWYLDQSGYVNVNSASAQTTYGRAGLKFKSIFEQQ